MGEWAVDDYRSLLTYLNYYHGGIASTRRLGKEMGVSRTMISNYMKRARKKLGIMSISEQAYLRRSDPATGRYLMFGEVDIVEKNQDGNSP